jgi:hypothetical protein
LRWIWSSPTSISPSEPLASIIIRTRRKASRMRCSRRIASIPPSSIAAVEVHRSSQPACTRLATLDRVYDFGSEAFDLIFDTLRTTMPCIVLDVPHQWTDGPSALVLTTS